MPDGRIVRIDSERECVYLIRKGRSYEASLTEVETAARIPSARVHFTVRRSNGVERAENVTLRKGTRTNRRQRRFGDLTGARQPGAKTRTTAQLEYGIDVTTQPFRVVRAWIAALTAGDVDAAASFYRPGAIIHSAEGPVEGHNRIRALLDSSLWIGRDHESIELHGMDRYVEASATTGDLHSTTFLIESGKVVEQWLGVAPPTPETEEDVPGSSRVLAKGEVNEADVDYAHHRIAHFQDVVGRPVNDFLMKLTQAVNPAVELPAEVEASADISGTFIRSHVSATTMAEGIDLAISRLRSKLDHHPDNRIPRSKPPTTGARRGDHPEVGGTVIDRPASEREIVRHKSFAPEEMTVDEAAWDMEQMDYDFFLFTELGSGSDCVLERTTDGTLHLQGLEDPSEALASVVIDVVARDQKPPSLVLREAIEYLHAEGARRLFFHNTATDRGNVLYRRFDGHYGLITPSAES